MAAELPLDHRFLPQTEDSTENSEPFKASGTLWLGLIQFAASTGKVFCSANNEEDKRMASRLIRNQLPRKGLRVRPPCPPLSPPFFYGDCKRKGCEFNTRGLFY